MFFLTFILPAILAYLYVGITVAKFSHYERVLDYKEPNSADSLSMGALWPLVLLLEPIHMRGVLYPTLWLWPRFRQEYPAIKADLSTQDRLEREMRRKDHSRNREEKRGALRLADVKADVQHARQMALIDRETDEMQERLINDHPPAIEAGERYQQQKDDEPEETTTEFYCQVHRHWVNDHSKRFNCV